ncbi:hypothetical protein ABZP36_027136 [Zizania latifolia]
MGRWQGAAAGAVRRGRPVMMLRVLGGEANKAATSYKNKVVKNLNSIIMIYSKDHAIGEGARTRVEDAHDMAAEGRKRRSKLATSISMELIR